MSLPESVEQLQSFFTPAKGRGFSTLPRVCPALRQGEEDSYFQLLF